MPSNARVGSAYYDINANDAKLKAALSNSDALIRKAGTAAETTFAQSFSKAAVHVGAQMQKIGRSMQGIGSSMTTNLTLPIVGVGAAAGKMAVDFDRTMNQIVGLTDVSRSEIQGFGEEILKMGPVYGRGPRELAEAFYFVASAGFDGADAMDVLEISAKAASTGLGDTQTIAKTLGGVINAYGKENMTAANAAGILTEAVSQGTAEASDFANVIGRVTPGAAALGVSFDQVAAALAGMTLTGLSAEESATSLIQVFSSLQKPTTQAEDALKEMGLSSAELRRQLAEEGLLPTLRTLEERFGGNEEAAAKVFGNIRALRGVTSLLTLDSTQLNEIFGKLASTTSDRLDVAFEETGKSAEFQLQQSLAKLEVTAIELGRDILPMVIDVLESVADAARGFAQWWGTLTDETKQSIIQWAGFLAIAGPVLRMVGLLTSALGGLTKAIGWLAGSQGVAKLSGALQHLGFGVLGPVGLAVGAFTTGMSTDFLGMRTRFEKDMKDMGDVFNRLSMDMGRQGVATEELADKVGMEVGALRDLVTDYMSDYGLSFEDALRKAEYNLGAIPIVADRSFEAYSQTTYAHMLAAKGHVVDTTQAMIDGQVQIFEDGSVVVGGAADMTAEEIAAAAEEARAEVMESMKATLQGMASLFESDTSVRDAWQALIDRMDDPYTEAERKADIFSQNTVDNIRDAIESGDPLIASDAKDLVNNMLRQVELMEPGALASGKAVPPAIRDGMNSSLGMLTSYLKTQHGVILEELTLEEAKDLGLDGIWLWYQGQLEGERRNAWVTNAIRSRAVNELGNTAGAWTGGYGILGSWFGGFIRNEQDRSGVVSGARNRAIEVLANTAGAWAGGRSIGSAWIDGIIWAIFQGNAGVWSAVQAVRHFMGGSLPEDGPLKGDTAEKGGRSVGKAWVAGLVSELSRAGYLMNSTLSIAPLMGQVGSVGGSNPTTNFGGITVNINGFSGSATETDQVARNLANAIRLRASSVMSY